MQSWTQTRQYDNESMAIHEFMYRNRCVQYVNIQIHAKNHDFKHTTLGCTRGQYETNYDEIKETKMK